MWTSSEHRSVVWPHRCISGIWQRAQGPTHGELCFINNKIIELWSWIIYSVLPWRIEHFLHASHWKPPIQWSNPHWGKQMVAPWQSEQLDRLKPMIPRYRESQWYYLISEIYLPLPSWTKIATSSANERGKFWKAGLHFSRTLHHAEGGHWTRIAWHWGLMAPLPSPVARISY